MEDEYSLSINVALLTLLNGDTEFISNEFIGNFDFKVRDSPSRQFALTLAGLS